MTSQSLHKEAAYRQVHHWMTKDVLTISRKENLLHAAKKMAKKNVSCLIVAEDNKPIGIITERDYLKKVVLEEKEPHLHLVEEVMTLSVRFLPEDADLVSAFQLMKKLHIRRFPVINRKGQLVGILTQKDIIEGMHHIIKRLDWKLVRAKILFSEFEKGLGEVDVV